jgi:DNA-binding CsgD family transcriptional regulator
MTDGFLEGLPDLLVGALSFDAARQLLLENVMGPIDDAVRDRIIDESRGNPLALIELPRTWRSPAAFAGGYGISSTEPVGGRVERSYEQRFLDLPPDTRLLAATAAAEPLGDPVILQRALEVLEIDGTALEPAIEADLLSIGTRVRFAHPLARSAAYRICTTADRRRVHRSLAEVTDPQTDPDRRAWHRACAASGHSEEVASELERSAASAQARGGVAAAAAFLERAVGLTGDARRRGERALLAAQANLRAGAFDVALSLLAAAEATPLSGAQRARAQLLRAQVAFSSGSGGEKAPSLLYVAAKGLEPFDLRLARETYLAAWGAAGMAGSMARKVLWDICEAIHALPPTSEAPPPLDLLLEGLALVVTEGPDAAAPVLQRAARELQGIAPEDVLSWGWMATYASSLTWDIESLHAISARHVRIVIDAGALAQLPLHLWQLAHHHMWTGDLAGAAGLAAQSASVTEATGGANPPYTTVRLLALQGRQEELTEALSRAKEIDDARSQAITTSGRWAEAVLYNGLGRYRDAARSAADASADGVTLRPAMWALVELVEAAVRSGEPSLASDALVRLVNTTRPCDTDFARGIEARSRALVAEGPAAEHLYEEAIERLSRTPLRPELARSRLVFGEWLRREGRRVEAREQLRHAHATFEALGMEAFAERARRELTATGERVRKRGVEARDQLTPQEEQIARLARDGLSNPEIGAQLFISARTVEWHLRKVFTKLGVSSRAVPTSRGYD